MEILLTIVQSYLGFLFLVSMDFSLIESVGLFTLWLLQLLVPGLLEELIWVYTAWAAWETLQLILHFHERNAIRVFFRLCGDTVFKRSG